MKEFLLSFDNTQQKRQKELFMEYRTYSIQKQYLFVYQRDGISLDVEYFKDLVSFSKKPTRSSLLYLEWVSSSVPIRLDNGFVNVKSRKPFTFLPIATLARLIMRKGIALFNQIHAMDMIFNRHIAKFENFLIEPKNKINVNISKNLFLNHLKANKTEIFQNNFYFKDYILNSFQNENISSSHEKFTEEFENIFAQTSHEKFLNKFDVLFLYHDYVLNHFDMLPLSADIKSIINIDSKSILSRNKSYGFTIRQFLAKSTNTILHINYFNETILGLPLERYLNYFENNTASIDQRLWNVFENITAYGPGSNHQLNYFNGSLAERENSLRTNELDNVYGITLPKNVLEYEINALHLAHQRIINDLYGVHNLIYKTLPYTVSDYNETLFGKREDSIYTQYFNNESFLNKHVGYVFMHDYVISGRKYDYNLHAFDNDNAKRSINANLNAFSYDMMHKYHSFAFTKDSNDLLAKDADALSIFNDYNILLNKYAAELSIYNYESFIYSIRKDIGIYHTEQNLIRVNNGVALNTETRLLYKPLIDIVWYNDQFFVFKGNLDVALFNTDTSLTKYPEGLKAIYEDLFLNKASSDIRYNNNFIAFDKTLSELFITTNQYYMNKFAHSLFIANSPINFLKEYRDITLGTDYIHELIKTYLPVMMQTDLSKALVALNKINQPLFTKDLLESITKRRKNIFIDASTNTVFTDKLSKDIFVIDNLFCDKLSRDVAFINIVNESVVKKQIKTWFINEDIFINKYAHRTNIIPHDSFVTKIMHTISLSDAAWVQKSARDIIFFDQQETFQTVRTLFERDTLVPFTKFYTVAMFSQDWFTMIKHVFLNQQGDDIYKKYKNTLIQQENHFINKSVKDFDDISSTEEHLNIERFMYLNQIDQITRVNNFPVEFYEQFFVTKDMFLDVLPDLNELQKIVKEINITTDNTLDWAWVYQEDEPFDDPFKIDELLLPENDSRYEDFENIIFNRETGKPRNPVQVIDDYTFIAKYPIHYPIKDKNDENAYKDVAVEYLDVRTSIMKRVFLGYYQLWQDHIFEFSRMTIPQSAKKILDYLYVWIFMSFAEEDIPEALRTFRLIRWYLERGIIETSEYCIKFEPGDIKCNMLTTQLEIPCDLYPTDGSPPNNSMFVDPNLHIIRNDPNRLRREAHFTMYIDNKKDTLVSFDLHTLTPVYIILNEELDNEEILDSITIPTTGKMVYNIPYTGDINTLTIRKHAIDNNDNEFYIGHIIVPGLNNKDAKLDIEFNPSKIQGNKVLNYVSQKVIAYTNLFTDNEAILKGLVQGNIHLSEVYEHLLEYWELHHQNKDKGKRLTIKRT